MATQQEYAQLSLYVYDIASYANEENRPELPSTDWQELEYHPDRVDGFSYGVFRNNVTGEVVLAYAGTNSNIDWLANVQNAIGLSSTQTTAAALAYLQAKQLYGSNISFTGHSLGGGLASIMAVWFDRPAVVFDEAPFELTARNTPFITITKAALALAGYSDDAFTSYTGLLDFYARESQVTNYYTSEEVLQDFRANWPTVVGVGMDNRIDLGVDNMLNRRRDLHSMALLAAGLMDDNFRSATVAVQRSIPLIMDGGLYAYDAATSSNPNLLIDLIRSEQANPGSGKLTHFAADLQKLGTDIGGLNQAAQDAIIAQGIEWYYWQGTDYAGQEFFTQTGELLQYTTANGDALAGAQNKAFGYVAKWLDPLVQAYGSYQVRYDYDQWNIVAGSDGASATARDATKSQIFIGGAGIDTFTGGNKGDVFYAGEGNDILNGGDGDIANDWLYGGAGDDTYRFNGTWGTDTIIDSDGAGHIELDGVTLEGGKKVAEGVWINKDQGILYTLVGSGADQMLVIQRDSSLNSIRVKGWQNGNLGLTMDDDQDEAQEPTHIFNGDQRALLRGIEVDQGVILPGSPNYNTYDWGAATWGADGTLNGGVAEADFNDVIYGSAGSDTIDGGAGNDVILGATGLGDGRGHRHSLGQQCPLTAAPVRARRSRQRLRRDYM